METRHFSEIWKITSVKIGSLEPFKSERDMQSFLMNNPSVIGCVLPELVGIPLKPLKEQVFLKGERAGFIDIIGLGKAEDDTYELRIFELKLGEIDENAVNQLSFYLNNWKNNEKLKSEVKNWLKELGLEQIEESYLDQIVNNPAGVLVGSRFSPESIKRILEIKEYKIKGIRLARFKSDISGEKEYFIIIEDQIGKIISATRRRLSWSDLIKAGLIRSDDKFIMSKDEIKIAGYPDKESINLRQFKLVLDDDSIKLLLDNEETIKSTAKNYQPELQRWVPGALNNLKSKKAITISQATGLFCYAFSGNPGSYWVATPYWIHEPSGKRLSDLTRELAERNE